MYNFLISYLYNFLIFHVCLFFPKSIDTIDTLNALDTIYADFKLFHHWHLLFLEGCSPLKTMCVVFWPILIDRFHCFSSLFLNGPYNIKPCFFIIVNYDFSGSYLSASGNLKLMEWIIVPNILIYPLLFLRNIFGSPPPHYLCQVETAGS